MQLFTLKRDAVGLVGVFFPKARMTLALTISIVADLLDYVAAPLLGIPIIGDVFDLIVIRVVTDSCRSVSQIYTYPTKNSSFFTTDQLLLPLNRI